MRNKSMEAMFVAALCSLAVLSGFGGVSLNGSWDFRFEEGKTLEEAARPDFVKSDTIVVPSCFDVMPKWYLRQGTGLYRRTFSLETAMREAVLVIDGMGVRAKFAIDGRELGVRVTPYAKLEIPIGPLAAGTHTIFAAVDNILEWPRVKLARPYYDFRLYGGLYHGVKIVEREPKVFVRTRDYAKGEVEVEIVGERAEKAGGERTLVFDSANEVKAVFANGRATVVVPDFRPWSPEQPNLHTVAVRTSPASSLTARFGIRKVEAKGGRIFLNGTPIFLKGFNRHESSPSEGAATGEATMLRDLQNLKSVGGNFIRGAHYQQAERFLDLCDEMGVLVWEESLGWGNGQGYVNNSFPPNELKDAEFCDLQVRQTREMVRASLNHPSVIICGFLNECNGALPECKALVDRLAEAVRAERSGRLVTFAANVIEEDIACANVDLVSFNAYPGTIPALPGTPAQLKTKVAKRFGSAVRLFRERYPDKPIMISESGCGGMYGVHDPNASVNTEEYQDEYLTDILETLWANPEVSGFAIWQMNDGRTRERYCDRSCSAMFGGSVAGCFDAMRRPKRSVETVRRFFSMK